MNFSRRDAEVGGGIFFPQRLERHREKSGTTLCASAFLWEIKGDMKND